MKFGCSWAECYFLHYKLQSATRIILPVVDFFAYKYEDLYFNVLKKHDFTKYISPQQTLAVEASTTDPALRDQRMVAMKVKDALVDQFRNKFKERPSINTREPDLKVVVKITKSRVGVSIDLTGQPLSFRGYRLEQGEAPLREHIAGGLLRYTQWGPPLYLVDPMCGSGTFLIEAALRVSGGKMQKTSREFAFQKLANFKREVGEVVKQKIASSDCGTLEPGLLFGFDKNPAVIEAAKFNAKRAGVDHLIKFETRDFRKVDLPVGPGVIVVNPPYGERLEDLEAAKQLYVDFGKAIKQKAPNWDLWVLSGHGDLTQNLKMKSEQKIQVMNGPIECRWVHYKILPPKSLVASD